MIKKIYLIVYTNLGFILCNAQPFSPITLTGQNHDIVAETGTSSLTTTTIPVDASVASNKVMYTIGFKTSAGLGGGGLADNGLVTDAAGTYQLAPYNVNNAFLIQRSQNRDVLLATPAKYNNIRLLGFSTEGSSLLNITLFFTDGTSTNVLTGYSLGDWFNGTTNLVLQGFGRCTRATPASGADGYTTNPRMYFINIPISCVDAQKNLQKINVANVTTAGTNAPYPNTVIMALSGKSTISTTVSTVVTDASCSSGGSAALTLTGASPFTVSWNTAPVQTGTTATNLAPGTYTATITDANGCITTSNATIALVNNIAMSSRLDTTLCQGGSFSPNITSNATTISWTPTTGVSNPNIVNPVLTPLATTTYTVTGTIGTCTISRSFKVNVNQGVTVNAGADAIILQGGSTQLQGAGTAGTYLWSPATGLSATNIINPIANPTSTTTYSLRITTPQGCTNTDDVVVTVVPYCVAPMNAFTPNGDGINDKWLVTNGNCVSNVMVQVYGRYGGKVYENKDYKNDWTGTYKGKPLPDGTYYYVVTYNLINGNQEVKKGDVTILR